MDILSERVPGESPVDILIDWSPYFPGLPLAKFDLYPQYSNWVNTRSMVHVMLVNF